MKLYRINQSNNTNTADKCPPTSVLNHLHMNCIHEGFLELLTHITTKRLLSTFDMHMDWVRVDKRHRQPMEWLLTITNDRGATHHPQVDSGNRDHFNVMGHRGLKHKLAICFDGR